MGERVDHGRHRRILLDGSATYDRPKLTQVEGFCFFVIRDSSDFGCCVFGVGDMQLFVPERKVAV